MEHRHKYKFNISFWHFVYFYENEEFIGWVGPYDGEKPYIYYNSAIDRCDANSCLATPQENYERVYAKRLIWYDIFNRWPEHNVVSYCGNYRCVQPRHLTLSRGTKTSQFSEEEKETIKALWASGVRQQTIADDYKVSRDVIYKVIASETLVTREERRHIFKYSEDLERFYKAHNRPVKESETVLSLAGAR